MIRVKRSKVQMIGSTKTVLSELTLAIVNGAEILSNQSKLSIEESIDVICNIARQSYEEVKKHEKYDDIKRAAETAYDKGDINEADTF